jgi:hypothetical protein
MTRASKRERSRVVSFCGQQAGPDPEAFLLPTMLKPHIERISVRPYPEPLLALEVLV